LREGDGGQDESDEASDWAEPPTPGLEKRRFRRV
jgi:hypothetical protein